MSLLSIKIGSQPSLEFVLPFKKINSDFSQRQH
jgi:hypothetical protein